MSTAQALSPSSRAESLKKLEETELDVLVIGGGVVGAGSALDAATRGLKVGLVEARDFASGTSKSVQQVVPRRSALPRAVQFCARVRGTA